jgi:cation transport regulator ChaB
MALACLAGLGIFAGGLAAWSAIMWYKDKGHREREPAMEEEEHKEALAEQLA